MVSTRQHWLVVGGAGSVWCGTDWYFVVLGQYSLILLGNNKAFMPVHIEESGDLVGCHHSGTDKRTNKKGKIGLLSQWTMEG